MRFPSTVHGGKSECPSCNPTATCYSTSVGAKVSNPVPLTCIFNSDDRAAARDKRSTASSHSTPRKQRPIQSGARPRSQHHTITYNGSPSGSGRAEVRVPVVGLALDAHQGREALQIVRPSLPSDAPYTMIDRGARVGNGDEGGEAVGSVQPHNGAGLGCAGALHWPVDRHVKLRSLPINEQPGSRAQGHIVHGVSCNHTAGALKVGRFRHAILKASAMAALWTPQKLETVPRQARVVTWLDSGSSKGSHSA